MKINDRTKKLEVEVREKLEEYDIPKHTIGALVRYTVYGMGTGDFLQGILTNNLDKAVFNADGDNTEKLVDIYKAVYHQLPANCWGDKEKYIAWIKKGGLSNDES